MSELRTIDEILTNPSVNGLELALCYSLEGFPMSCSIDDYHLHPVYNPASILPQENMQWNFYVDMEGGCSDFWHISKLSKV